MPFAVSGGSFWYAWNKFCEGKELGALMKQGDTSTEVQVHELGFQDGDQVMLLHELYKISVPCAEMGEKAEEALLALSTDKPYTLVDEALVNSATDLVRSGARGAF